MTLKQLVNYIKRGVEYYKSVEDAHGEEILQNILNYVDLNSKKKIEKSENISPEEISVSHRYSFKGVIPYSFDLDKGTYEKLVNNKNIPVKISEKVSVGTCSAGIVNNIVYVVGEVILPEKVVLNQIRIYVDESEPCFMLERGPACNLELHIENE